MYTYGDISAGVLEIFFVTHLTIGFDICSPKQAQAQAGGPTERHAEARGLCLSFLIFEATAVVQSHII